MRTLKRLCVSVLLTQAVAAPPEQIPLQKLSVGSEDAAGTQGVVKKRPLYGRFLQITDFHPDNFYEVYSSTAKDAACHSGSGPAGIYGAESSDCDSPISLVNKTMEWVRKEFRDSVDFVVWTGDSARHDNDEDIPRNRDQVVGNNAFMVQKMFEAFGKDNGDEEDEDPNNDYVVPIIPTFGNNDILPHNIFSKGPNKWTREYTWLWRQFIPEEQRHQFDGGGWFYVEVIPDKLAVFSLNTMYFFTSNAATDGCAQHSEPGYQQMEWLRTQLQFMRDRGIKAILTGHVPPVRTAAKTTWDETCWQKYTLWLRQFRDVVVSSHYGHVNYDHFILQDFEDLKKGTKKGKMPNYQALDVEEDDDFHTAVSPNYFIELRDAWSKFPDPPKSLKSIEVLEHALMEIDEIDGQGELKSEMMRMLKSKKRKRRRQEKKYLKRMGGAYAERYAAAFVSASIVPNLYPALRVFEYNITGLDLLQDQTDVVPSTALPNGSEYESEGEVEIEKKRKKKKSGKKKFKFEVPTSPSKSSPPGPAYSPQTFSLVRFTQYLANLTHINNDFHHLTAPQDTIDATKWNPGKHHGKKPREKDSTPHPKKFKFEKQYDTRDDDVYRLEDLTMPNIVDLARRIGKFEPLDSLAEPEAEEDSEVVSRDIEVEKSKKHKKKKKKKARKKRRKQNQAWYAFVRRAFVETLGPDELEDEFGS